MKKLLTKIINNTCENCPYCKYDSDYCLSYDSGYDCTNEDLDRDDIRIANDFDLQTFDELMDEFMESQNTLFPMDKMPMGNPLLIPDWCPLPDVSDKEEDSVEMDKALMGDRDGDNTES